VMLKDKEVFETVIPTKMLEFMSCARPVILAVRGQAKRVLEAAGGGICIEPDNPQALCSAILQLQQSPGLCAEMGKYGRNYIVRELSREKTALQYLSMLKVLVEGTPKQSAVAA
jgi:colanic acid biosynthesis glycosyl transferase WcaI